MKVLVLLFSLFFTISCSLSEETQQTSELNVSESTVLDSTAPIFNGEMNSRMVRESAWTHTLIETNVSGTDWRNSKHLLKNTYVWEWLISSHGKKYFHFQTKDGHKTYFNYTFFNDRKDVWYSVVRNGLIIQTGWTTVKLLERRLTYAPGRYSDYALIQFDVKFHSETQMKQILMVQRKARSSHRGVIWGGSTEDFGLESSYNKTAFDRGSFFFGNGHIASTIMKPAPTINYTSGSDWRNSRNSLKNNAVWNWLITSQQPRSFNYYSPSGGKYWFTYIFDNTRKEISYTIVRNGLIIQTGWTTVKLLERRLTYAPGRYSDYALIQFDVKFHSETQMKQILMVQRKARSSHRGVIWGGSTEDFGLESSYNKTAFDRGSFFFGEGHIAGR